MFFKWQKRRLIKKKFFYGIVNQCIYAKNHHVPFKTSLNKSPIPFIHVFTNVWGPFSTLSALDHKYFVSFIDDCTRVSWVNLLKSKNDVLYVIPRFSKMIITQFNTQVKAFHSDNGCEFVNQSLADFSQIKWNPPPNNMYKHATTEQHSRV